MRHCRAEFRVGPAGQSKLPKDPADPLQMNVLQRKIAGRWGETARREECSDMAAASDLSWGLSLTRTTPFPVMWQYLTIAWPFLVHQNFDMAHGRSYSGTGWQNLAAFRREQNWQWKFSLTAYLQFLHQMHCFCAESQICKINSEKYAIYTM